MGSIPVEGVKNPFTCVNGFFYLFTFRYPARHVKRLYLARIFTKLKIYVMLSMKVGDCMNSNYTNSCRGIAL